MIASSSVVMLNTAQAYWDLGCFAEVELSAAKTKDILETAGLTKCYVFAECKRIINTCNLLFNCLSYDTVTIHDSIPQLVVIDEVNQQDN